MSESDNLDDCLRGWSDDEIMVIAALWAEAKRQVKKNG